jgi:hypothetical protein
MKLSLKFPEGSFFVPRDVGPSGPPAKNSNYFDGILFPKRAPFISSAPDSDLYRIPHRRKALSVTHAL